MSRSTPLGWTQPQASHSVFDNARFFAATYGVRDKEAVMEALAVVDLADRVDTAAMDLSGGQRGRLSLACALIHKPAKELLEHL